MEVNRKTIFIWGTGFAAGELLENELKDVDIEAFIDRKASDDDNLVFAGKKVLSPEKAVTKDYDLIIVAIGNAASVYRQAKELGFDLSRFFFVYGNYFFEDMNADYEIVKDVFPSESLNVIRNRYHIIRGMHCDELGDSILESGSYRHGGGFADDYTRIRTLELCAQEIIRGNIPGNIAELGVYRGDFSRYLNRVFPDRILYLFDTFEGFDEQESQKEKADGNCGDAFIERFKNTTISTVLDKMAHPDKTVIKKGLFPDSLEGLEDSFAFVSIDVDFEQSIYNGLKYFYPRLESGGYIFIHDYNSASLSGVKKAVARYEADEKVHLCKCPISDLEGSLVITK